MSLQEYYEETYRQDQNRGASDLLQEATAGAKGLYNFALESKERFLPDVDWKGLRVLETGAGRGGVGLLLARLGARVTLVDFSPSALAQARDVYSAAGLEVETVEGDVVHPDLVLPHRFELIIDSHLLHCLTEDPDRASYYRLISDHLSPGGIFVAESMVHRKNLVIPDGFMLDQRFVLWQLLGSWTPVRRILDSLALEEELNNSRFNIVYFYYYGQLGFVPHRSFLDLPTEILPAAVRLVVQNRQ